MANPESLPLIEAQARSAESQAWSARYGRKYEPLYLHPTPANVVAKVSAEDLSTCETAAMYFDLHGNDVRSAPAYAAAIRRVVECVRGRQQAARAPGGEG